MKEYPNLFSSQSARISRRALSQYLMLSIGLNVALVGTLVYQSFVESTNSAVKYDLKPIKKDSSIQAADAETNCQVVQSLRKLSFEQLVASLNNTQIVEEGYCQRDLALAALVHFHYFNIEKALPGQRLQQRQLIIDQMTTPLVVFPGLSDSQFQAIVEYAHTERWPLQGKGLFLRLQAEDGLVIPSLADAFFLTPEFTSVRTLFNRTATAVDSKLLLQMLTEGNWEQLELFVQGQRVSQDLSTSRRQQLLVEYIMGGSKSAAYLLLLSDNLFALKKLDDQQVLQILSLLTEKTREAENFAKELLLSLRCDAVLQAAAAKLYQFAGETPPPPTEYLQALTRFFPETAATQPIKSDGAFSRSATIKVQPQDLSLSKSPSKLDQALPASIYSKQEKFYITQPGDNLWKIGRRYNVSIEVLKKYNQLKDDRLQPGQAIKIP